MVGVQWWLSRRRLANGKVPLWSQEREDLPLDFSASRTGRSAGGRLEGGVKDLMKMIDIMMSIISSSWCWYQVSKYCLWPGRSGTQRSERRARKFKTFWKKTLGSSRFRYWVNPDIVVYKNIWSFGNHGAVRKCLSMYLWLYLNLMYLYLQKWTQSCKKWVEHCCDILCCANFRRFYWTKLDWIVRPGYSLGGYILGCSQRHVLCLWQSAGIGPVLLCHPSWKELDDEETWHPDATSA